MVDYVLINYALARCAAEARRLGDPVRRARTLASEATLWVTMPPSFCQRRAQFVALNARGDVPELIRKVRAGREAADHRGDRRAIALCESCDLLLYRDAARYCLGFLMDHGERDTSMQQAERALRARGIDNPPAMLNVLCPGILVRN